MRVHLSLALCSTRLLSGVQRYGVAISDAAGRKAFQRGFSASSNVSTGSQMVFLPDETGHKRPAGEKVRSFESSSSDALRSLPQCARSVKSSRPSSSPPVTSPLVHVPQTIPKALLDVLPRVPFLIAKRRIEPDEEILWKYQVCLQTARSVGRVHALKRAPRRGRCAESLGQWISSGHVRVRSAVHVSTMAFWLDTSTDGCFLPAHSRWHSITTSCRSLTCGATVCMCSCSFGSARAGNRVSV